MADKKPGAPLPAQKGTTNKGAAAAGAGTKAVTPTSNPPNPKKK